MQLQRASNSESGSCQRIRDLTAFGFRFRFDSYTTAWIAALRQSCSSVPKRSEPRSLWTLPTSSTIPVLAVAGGADPQDPAGNLWDLKEHFPNSRIFTFPHLGHDWEGIGGCLNQTVTDFVDRGASAQHAAPGQPSFPLTD